VRSFRGSLRVPLLRRRFAGLSRDFQPDYPRARIRADRVRDCATLKAYLDRKQRCPAGFLRDSPVLDACNGRPVHRFSINSSPTKSNSCHSALYARFAACAAGQPLQGERRRFESVSTRQSSSTLSTCRATRAEPNQHGEVRRLYRGRLGVGATLREAIHAIAAMALVGVAERVRFVYGRV
jgi:hypothetical protein